MWNRRLRRPWTPGDGRADRRPAPPRIPGLRLGGRRDLRPGRDPGAPRARQAREPGGHPARQAGRRADGHRPHALGHPRQALGAKRPSSQSRRRGRRPQRHHRELPQAASGVRGGRPEHGVRHRHRADRAPDRPRDRLGQGPALGVARGLRPPGGLLRLRGALDPQPRLHRRRQERRQSDHPGARREADLPGQRHPGDPALHATDGVPRGRRLRAALGGRRADRRHRGAAPRARAQADPVGSGLGGEGRLRPLHAEGDLRAAARDHGHDRDAGGRVRGRHRPERHRFLPRAPWTGSAA